MSNFKQFLTAAVLAGGVLLSSIAHAAISYSYVTDQSTYTVAAGTVVPVHVYLKETLTTPSTSLIALDGGLDTAGFAINSTGTPPASASALTSFTKNSAFGGNASNDPTTASHLGATVSVAGGGTNLQPDVNGLILLGTVDITAGNAPGTTNFLLGEYDAAGGNTYTAGADGLFDDLDFNSGVNGNASSPAYTGVNTLTTPFSITVAAPVPEPASLSLLALGGFGLLTRRRRRA